MTEDMTNGKCAGLDRHHTILQRIRADLAEKDPICSITVVGSVGRGDYHPGSDIDIVVVSWRCATIASELPWENARIWGQSEHATLGKWIIDGIRVDMLCYSPTAHQATIMTAPVWRFDGKMIIYDPSGIAAWGQQCIAQFQKDNPEFLEKWNDFQEDYKQCKKDNTRRPTIATLEEFMAGLDYSKAVFCYKSFVDTVMDQRAEDEGKSNGRMRRDAVACIVLCEFRVVRGEFILVL